MKRGPLPYLGQDAGRKASFQDLLTVNRDRGIVFRVRCVKVRWPVIVPVHFDHDPIELADARHPPGVRETGEMPQAIVGRYSVSNEPPVMVWFPPASIAKISKR